MRITHYLYNAFLIEEGDTRIAIDPGQYFWIFDFRSLIPEEEWPTVTHIVITHGDPDHHWQSDRAVRSVHGPIEISLLGFTIRKEPVQTNASVSVRWDSI